MPKNTWFNPGMRTKYQGWLEEDSEKERSFTDDWCRYQCHRSEWAPEPGPEPELHEAPDLGPMPFLGLMLHNEGGELSCEQGILTTTWAFFKFVYAFKKPHWAVFYQMLLGIEPFLMPVLSSAIINQVAEGSTDILGQSGLYILLYVVLGLLMLFIQWKFNNMFPQGSVRMALRNIYHRKRIAGIEPKLPCDAGMDAYAVDTLCDTVVGNLWAGGFSTLSRAASLIVSVISASVAIRGDQRLIALLTVSNFLILLTPCIAYWLYEAVILRTTAKFFQQQGRVTGLVVMDEMEPKEEDAQDKLTKESEMQLFYEKFELIRYLHLFQNFLTTLSAQQLQWRLTLLIQGGTMLIIIASFDSSDAKISHQVSDFTYAVTSLTAFGHLGAGLMRTVIGFSAGYVALLPLAAVFNTTPNNQSEVLLTCKQDEADEELHDKPVSQEPASREQI